MYAFQLSFPFPGVVPAFLHIVQNRKILRNDLIIHFFWHKFQPTMFPALFFLSSLAGCALKHITCLIQWKDRQKTNLQKVQTERVLPSQLTEISLNWPCKLLSTYKRWIDRVRHRCRNEWHRPGLTQPAVLPMTLHRQTVQKKLFYWVHIHAQALWMDYTCWSINHPPTPGCLWNQALCYLWTRRTKLMQLALLKTPINKPQSTHATHNLITSKDSKRFELFEVGLFSHKSYMRRWLKPY